MVRSLPKCKQAWHSLGMGEDETLDDADLSAGRRTKAGVFIAVALLHVVAVLALIRAFAPDFTNRVVEKAFSAFTVTITAPPEPEPKPAKAQDAAGKSGAEGKKAKPKEVAAPKPKVAIAKAVAPANASTGNAVTSGARDAGNGTGAGGRGNGPGSGNGGDGTGGGAPTKAVHISGQLNNARDFPIPAGGREERIGKSVIVALTISPEGRAVGCRVYRGSGLPDTDAATCRLAMEKLRFRPATNSAGQPVTSTFYWQQKFFF